MRENFYAVACALSFLVIAACATTSDDAIVSQTDGEAISANSVEKAPTAEPSELTKTATVSNAEKEEVDDDRVICKRRAPTGSRFKVKECRTWREWKQIEENSRALVDGNQRASRFNTPAGGGR